ncbi:MAG: nicotinate-nucleotide--dimethylbenzimidazole phosphoribosyltransferase [Eubacteriales bacterium]|jgi:nicotinate-nucleotide--dimethylbenzimidazole phosphoribosyltransferase
MDRDTKMTGELLQETVRSILPPDKAAEKAAVTHWDSIAHPLHSLGRLEDAVVQIAGIQRTPKVDISEKALIIMCADNGVVEEGVTQTGQEVTAQVAENFLSDRATAAILCRETGAEICPVDIGMARDTKVRNCKVACGTRNMTKGPAMTREEAVRAIETGIRIAREKVSSGSRILATGEMGIGNTTTSSAVVSVLLERDPAEVTGRGAGLSSEGLERKISAIRRALALNRPDASDAIDVLSKVGGFDLAGLAGVFIGGAGAGVPVVIDGFISAAAALAAVRICPGCLPYMMASHVSGEPAASMVLAALDKKPLLTCEMCLGEGSGAVMIFPLLDMALKVYNSMTTFEEDHIEAYQHLN